MTKNTIPPRLKDICPIWYERLVNEDEDSLYEYKYLDMNLFESCVVGEKHGFSSVYARHMHTHRDNCSTCVILAHSLQRYYRVAGKDRQFTKQLNEFVEHCEEKHHDTV